MIRDYGVRSAFCHEMKTLHIHSSWIALVQKLSLSNFIFHLTKQTGIKLEQGGGKGRKGKKIYVIFRKKTL